VIARRYRTEFGFTLLEMTIVLAVLGVVIAATVQPVAARLEQSQRRATRNTIEQVIEAAIGFAGAQGHLPCPASDVSMGWALEKCTGPAASGFVPAASLGLSGPRDAEGRLLDSWSRPLHYIVSVSDHAEQGVPGQPDFTTPGELRRVGMRSLRSELVICTTAVETCAKQDIRANQVPLVVLSTGRLDRGTATELENQDHDNTFVVQPYTTLPEHEFDDLLGWISENILFYRLIQAGELP